MNTWVVGWFIFKDYDNLDEYKRSGQVRNKKIDVKTVLKQLVIDGKNKILSKVSQRFITNKSEQKFEVFLLQYDIGEHWTKNKNIR